ncbi:MAG: RNA ligase family protein [Polyangiales bacterium]
MHKFTHISAFYQVARYLDQMREDPEIPERYVISTPVRYRGTVKLHGSNSGVHCTPGLLIAQSRTREITPKDDNYGFAAFVALEDTQQAIRTIEARIRAAHEVEASASLVLFGEWIGPGVQKGVALSALPEKQWVLFAVRLISGEEGQYIDALPRLGNEFADVNIYSVMDAPVLEIVVDYQSTASKTQALETATAATAEVEAACPWAKRFDTPGVGEGLVWAPLGEHWGNSDLMFKTKGQKHQIVKPKKPKLQLTPEVLQGISDFVEFAVTDARLDQGLGAVREMGHAFEMRSLPHFLKWVAQDVRRECEPELEDNGLDWKAMSRAITRKARDFFMERVNAAALV